MSASIHYNTLKVRKIYSYNNSQFVKTPIVHHLLLSSSSVQMAYRETGVSNRSNSFTKITYTGAYMILDAQNLHTCSQSRQNSGSATLQVSVWTPFSSRAEHVKLVLLPWSRCRCYDVWLLLLCSFVSVSLND